MLNYETLLSSYDDKLTLMQWLKKVEAALKDASAVSFNVNKKGDATLTFSIVFEDGSEIESGEIVLQQGESVESAAIVNGHLILTLTNGDELDAGQLLNGDLNVSGNLAVSGNIASNGKITGAEIVEDMAGYSFAEYAGLDTAGTRVSLYAGAVKNGNKLTLVYAYQFTPNEGATGSSYAGVFTIPNSIGNKIIPFSGSTVDVRQITATTGVYGAQIPLTSYLVKTSGVNVIFAINGLGNLTAGTTYYIRQELTILLSDNLA